MLSAAPSCLLVLVALCGVRGSSVCRPGAVWRPDDITVCKCAPGGRPVCDTRLSARQFQRRADQVQDEHADCRAGQSWTQECSRCQCVADGLWFCEFRGCGAPPAGAENDPPSYLDMVKPVPYKGNAGSDKPVPYMGNEGNGKPVPYQGEEGAGKPVPYMGEEGAGKPVPYQGDGCTPGDSYMKECNQCWCNDKGIEACTMMFCIDGSGDGNN